MEQVSLWIALGAGVLSFFSPCIFPILPAYVSHLTGGSSDNQKIPQIFWNLRDFAWNKKTMNIYKTPHIRYQGYSKCLSYLTFQH
ncbi:cytochrome c biogenesis protein CcdA [Bacillus fengqiuensis]|nr:cytochrome c biogenesis protein CcdA [Bacillus fengqiuensis]